MSDFYYLKGLERALEITKKEKEYAIKVNPQMAIGMSQIEILLKKEIKRVKFNE